ncbi:hypothetical protein ACGF5F_32410 [Streptomyces sp. NPDC047821]|uniref:hypothetical protein n=1 Tax=Streptomyces sp. NPDC047821 TaxID=3365488 RepID=UPI00371E5D78
MTAADLARVDVPLGQLANHMAMLQAARQLEGVLAEQRHQFLDLDADSQFTVPGSCCPACPPRTEVAS